MNFYFEHVIAQIDAAVPTEGFHVMYFFANPLPVQPVNTWCQLQNKTTCLCGVGGVGVNASLQKAKT
jgi:hypothetical protein